MLDHKKLEASGGKISHHPSEPVLLSARASLPLKNLFLSAQLLAPFYPVLQAWHFHCIWWKENSAIFVPFTLRYVCTVHRHSLKKLALAASNSDTQEEGKEKFCYLPILPNLFY
jgi:hypothetical protein